MCHDYYTCPIDYTFKCASHNSFTWIDYVFVSKPLLDNLVKVSIIDCGSNMSDHCIMGFKASLCHIVNIPVSINPAVPCVIVHDWSSTNQNMYYANTSLLLLNMYSNLLSCGAINCTNIDCTLDSHICNLESFCCNLVNILSFSSSHCIRQIKTSSQKIPWSNTLQQLKMLSIEVHRKWVINGKPRFGDIWLNKTKCHTEYKKSY